MKFFNIKQAVFLILAATSISACNLLDPDDAHVAVQETTSDDHSLLSTVRENSTELRYQQAVAKQQEYQLAYNTVRAAYLHGKAEEQSLVNAENVLIGSKLKSEELRKKVTMNVDDESRRK